LFERRVAEKYVRETGKCPITGEPLSVDDLLPLKSSKGVKPRTAPATSIPGLLGLFHDEWDALMLETHTLRQSLNTTRQELSHALYQHDAACRVIARLIKERDEARAALEDARAIVAAEQQAAGKRGADEAAGDAKRARVAQIPEEVLSELQEVNAQLSKQRKKRVIPESTATPDDLASLTLINNVPLHKTTQPGIAALDVSPSSSTIIATGGVDGVVKVYDSSAGRELASLEGHSKRVTGVVFASPSVLITSSADKTARIWRGAEDGSSFTCASVLKDHSGEVVGVTMHPSRKYFVTGSADASWGFWDLASATCLRQVSDEAVKEAYTTIQFHPDGLILGTGGTQHVCIYDCNASGFCTRLRAPWTLANWPLLCSP
jgi:pre-mRNA-processing factor 19